MSNENCLEDFKCPKCGQEDEFKIIGRTEFVVRDDGTDSFEGAEWDDDSDCRCGECDHRGQVKDFRPTVIIVHVRGGVVQDVEGVPRGVRVLVRDFDSQDDGKDYEEAVYELPH